MLAGWCRDTSTIAVFLWAVITEFPRATGGYRPIEGEGEPPECSNRVDDAR